MQTGEIGALYEGKTEKAPTSIYLKGGKQKYTCWDTKGKQKGDKIVFETKALPDWTNNKGEVVKQFQIDIQDITPVTDVNQDILPDTQPNTQPVAYEKPRNDINLSIESQVCLKGGIEVVTALIQQGQIDLGYDIDGALKLYSEQCARALVGAKEELERGYEFQESVIPEGDTSTEPF